MDSQGVEALACRRSFYIDAARSADYSDFRLGDEEPDSNGGRRRDVGINESLSRAIRSAMFAAHRDLSKDYSAFSEHAEADR